MKVKEIFTQDALVSPHIRAGCIAFISSLMASFYHIAVMIAFYCIGLRFMFLYNIASVICFPIITAFVPKAKSYIPLYCITIVEVIIHQIIADYFLGSIAGFHFFILLMGLLPFLVFEDKQKYALPFAIISTVAFIILECLNLPTIYKCENINRIVNGFRICNVTISIVTIVIVVIVYTYIAFKAESNLKNANTRLRSEINLAAIVQQSYFKQEHTSFDDWEIEFYTKPRYGVSGDIVDIFALDESLEGCALMDVSGHGISAGLVTMLVKNIVDSEFFHNPQMKLSDVLEKINERIIMDKGNIENYLTGILTRINGNELELVNAGHPSPLIFRHSSNQIEILEKPENAVGAIGLTVVPSVFISQTVTMEKDDEIIFYTDGITESINEKKEEYGVNRLSEIFMRTRKLSVKMQLESVLKDLHKFMGKSEGNDDISIIILRKK